MLKSSEAQETNKKERRSLGLLISLLCHLFLILLLVLPFLTTDRSEEEIYAIEFEFLNPENIIPTVDETISPLEISESQESAARKQTADPASPSKANHTENLSKNYAGKKVLTSDDVKAIFVKKIINKTESENILSDSKNNTENTEESIKAKQAQELALKKTAYEEKKRRFSGMINTNKQGNGDSGGDDEKESHGTLDGLTIGKSLVSGGLGNRKVIFVPKLEDNSQKSGKVIIAVCVNDKGHVTQAEFTQKGSSTTDQYLVQLAKRTAMKYLFSESTIQKQCGNIRFDFILK